MIEYRSAGGRAERFADYAAQLVRLKVDVIVTRGTPAAFAARNASATIPIVMGASGEPSGPPSSPACKLRRKRHRAELVQHGASPRPVIRLSFEIPLGGRRDGFRAIALDAARGTRGAGMIVALGGPSMERIYSVSGLVATGRDVSSVILGIITRAGAGRLVIPMSETEQSGTWAGMRGVTAMTLAGLDYRCTAATGNSRTG